MDRREVIISDFLKWVREKERLAEGCAPDRWELVDYETVVVGGIMLMASVFVSTDNVRTLTVGIQQMFGQYQTDWGPIGAALVISTLPTLILYLCMSGQVQRSLIAGAVKG